MFPRKPQLENLLLNIINENELPPNIKLIPTEATTSPVLLNKRSLIIDTTRTVGSKSVTTKILITTKNFDNESSTIGRLLLDYLYWSGPKTKYCKINMARETHAEFYRVIRGCWTYCCNYIWKESVTSIVSCARLYSENISLLDI